MRRRSSIFPATSFLVCCQEGTSVILSERTGELDSPLQVDFQLDLEGCLKGAKAETKEGQPVSSCGAKGGGGEMGLKDVQKEQVSL